MSGFQFPPPPPPPPLSSGSHFQVGSCNQSSSRGRGRGRGHGEQSDRLTGSKNGGYASSHQNRAPATSFHSASGSYVNRTVYSTPAGIPPGSYVNPAFARPTTTPSNSVTRTNFAGRQPHNVNTPAYASPSSSLTKSGASHIGSKRKLDSFKEPQSQSASCNSEISTPIRQPPSTVLPSRTDSGLAQQLKKSNANVLGLTPGTFDPHYTSSGSEDDDDIVDEEAMLAHGLLPNLTFHDTNGEMRTLNTAADLAAWRNARRANFPTKDRLGQKHSEKMQIGAERKRMLTEAKDALCAAMRASRPLSKAPSRARTELQAKVDESRPDSTTSRVASTAPADFVDGALSKREKTSEGDSAAVHSMQTRLPVSISKTDNEEAEEAHAEAVQISKPADERSQDVGVNTVPTSTRFAAVNDASDPDSSDDPPEEISSKQQQTAKTKSTPCRHFVASGYCRDGSTCRFKPELPDRVTLEHKRKVDLQKKDPFAPILDVADHHSRKTIHQRLLERDQDDQDQLALRVIKYLGSKRFFSGALRGLT